MITMVIVIKVITLSPPRIGWIHCNHEQYKESPMAQITANDFATRWKTRMLDPATQAKIKQGVQNPSRSWQQSTLAAMDFMSARWNESIRDGTWTNRVSNTSDAYWQRRTIDKGLPAMTNGVNNGVAAVQAFAQQFLPAVQAASAAAQALPRGGVENGVARASAFIRQMATFRYARPGR